MQAEFEIGEGVVTLVKFSAGSKPPVRGIQDKPMVLKDLVKEMRIQGVDIFPDYDSHCYIEGAFLNNMFPVGFVYRCCSN